MNGRRGGIGGELACVGGRQRASRSKLWSECAPLANTSDGTGRPFYPRVGRQARSAGLRELQLFFDCAFDDSPIRAKIR